MGLQSTGPESDLTVRECLRLYAGYYPAPREVDAVLIAIVVGSLSFCCLGYAMVSGVAKDAAAPVTQAVILPLYFISGIFFPQDQIPGWLVDVANVFPIRHLQQELLAAFNPAAAGSAIEVGHLAVLAAWGVAGAAFAFWRFAWVPRGE